MILNKYISTNLFLIFLFCLCGVNISAQDQFNYWEPLSPIPADFIQTMLIDDVGVIYAGTLIDGFFISFDYGDSWNSANINCILTTEDLALHPNGDVYAVSWGCLHRSSNNGLNWELVKYTFQCRTVFINSLFYIYSGEEQDWNVGRLYRSTDNGLSWEYYDFPNLEVVYSMDSDSYSNLYAGTTKGIYISIDNGDSWGNNQLQNEFIPCLTVTSNDIIVAGTWGEGIYRSTDSGQNWEQTSLTISEIRALTLDKNGYIWTGTNNGVFKSTNDGALWVPVNSSGLTNINIQAITIDPEGFIVVGVDSGKVFRTVGTTTSVTEILQVKDFSLFQNYPNPFNPNTTIKYKMPELSFVTLKVYDVLGNKVATLVNEVKPAGSYEVAFDGTGLPSGIYFYRLQAGNPSTSSGKSFVETKKMILIK